MVRTGAASFRDIRPSPRNVRLLKWLRRKPTPHSVVGETADGEERKAVVSLTGPTVWNDVISVVRECVRLEARDKEGNTLRVLELDPDDPDLRAESELSASHEVAHSLAKHGSVPLISVDIPRLVDNLARNMREVAAEAARQQAGAFKEGFSAMTNVVNLCLNLLTRVDERMAQVEQEADARALPVEESAPATPQDQRQQMAMMALQKVMGGNGVPTNGAPNMAQLLQMIQQYQQTQPDPEGPQ